ncbi:MAG TPA: sugar phosphate isomerase/epimerase family protein, partial [Candidatus Bathyarchaeia archaeon]|nr:sugar phosphate isomerase/epimerase family protein [Candidatus Bathyarchaeia archaeon]
VEPAKLETDFPRAVEAVRAAGSEVYMISTTLFSGDDPEARPIMAMAQKLGIPYVRIGGQMYSRDKNPAEELPAFTEQLRSLAALAEEYGLTLGYHNHSGYGNVGGPIWDLYEMIKAVGSPRLGSNFDGAHAAAEGAFGVWQTNARLMAPHVKMMAVKDFIWNKNKPAWVALGKGIVRTAEVFKIMRAAGFSGPVSMHFEYKVKDNNAMLAEIKDAAVTCRAEMKKAGYG